MYSLAVVSLPAVNETFTEQLGRLAPPGELSTGDGLFDLDTYLLYFCSLMWCSPADTLICGRSQVKCINHVIQRCTHLAA